MATPVNLGEFEQLVLLAILRLRDDAYGGVTIREELADRAGRTTRIPVRSGVTARRRRQITAASHGACVMKC